MQAGYDLSVVAIALLYFLAHGELQEEGLQDARLMALTEGFWHWKLLQYPEDATKEDFHDHDDKLESFNLSTFEYRKGNCSLFLQEAESIDEASLSRTDRLTLRILKDQLRTYTDGYRWKDYGNLSPLNFLEGMHKSKSMTWVRSARFTDEKDYNTYITRLQKFPGQITELIMLMRRAISLGTTNHRVSVVKVPSEIERYLNVSPQETDFYKPFRESLENLTISKHKRHELRRLGRTIIKDKVQPSFQRLLDFINEEYMPNTRSDYGVWSLPEGNTYYRALLRWYLSTDLSAEEVHSIGISEVNRIKNRMEKIIKQLNFKGNLTSFFDMMETKIQFYNHTEEDLVEGYRNIIFNRINPKLSKFFSNLTSIPPVKVSPISSDGIIAVYSDGTFLTNVKSPGTRPSFIMMAIALHETNPGHHLQVSLTQALPIPKFRRYLWGGRKYSAPLHFPYYTAMVEGWGLYAEYLGEEMGLYEDPYELFGRYTFEMFRACRLVVDTGIHAKRWTREEAIQYMQAHMFINRKEIEIEVDRYITWPGQACAYKIGELKIKALRKMAEEKLGGHFDIRAFHWEVLRQGFVPLQLMEESINDWVARQLPTSGAGGAHTSAYLSRHVTMVVTWVLLLITGQR